MIFFLILENISKLCFLNYYFFIFDREFPEILKLLLIEYGFFVKCSHKLDKTKKSWIKIWDTGQLWIWAKLIDNTVYFVSNKSCVEFLHFF